MSCVANFVAAPATNLAVNSTMDASDANHGDGICETTPGGGICTLRAAIDEVNACGSMLDVLLPAGTYTLTLAGRGDDRNATGDLDIRNAVRVIGAGRDLTVINGDWLDRVIDICPLGSCDATTVVELQQLTVRNGEVAGLVDAEVNGTYLTHRRGVHIGGTTFPPSTVAIL